MPPDDVRAVEDRRAAHLLELAGRLVNHQYDCEYEMLALLREYVALSLEIDYPDASLASADVDAVVSKVAGQILVSGSFAYEVLIRRYVQDVLAGRAAHAPAPVRGNQVVAGEPVLMSSGELVHQAEDLRVNGAGISFTFRRTYRSQAIFNGPLGARWDHSYNVRLTDFGTHLELSTGDLRQHVYWRHAGFGSAESLTYYVPPDGVDAVIEPLGDSFVRRAPDGVRHAFERDPGWSDQHRVRRVEDRFGNYLEMRYDAATGLLERVLVNHGSRPVRFAYDDFSRVVGVTDFTGRRWTYEYDDLGDLVAVWTPPVTGFPAGLVTRLEYSSRSETGIAAHRLVRMCDPDGRLVLETEYGRSPGTPEFNRVVRQREGAGTATFAYEDVEPVFEADYGDAERPTRQVTMVGRNGSTVHYVFSMLGNLLLKEQIVAGQQGLLRWRYRYNRDGALTASLSPEGSVVQHLYGRDDFARRFGVEDQEALALHAQLTAAERLAFGRLLATVRRGRRYDIASMNLGRGVFGAIFPDVMAAGPDDVIVKLTYEPDYGQLVTQSDPRTTTSADPGAIEPPEYHSSLTRYEYRGPPGDPSRLLARAIRPRALAADGTAVPPAVEEFAEYDGRGRLLRTTDALGVTTRYDYFGETDAGPSGASLEGHLRLTVVDDGGRAATTEYEVDELGRSVLVRMPRAAELPGRFTTRTDFNALDQPESIVSSSPFSAEVRRRYGASGLLAVEERDARDHTGADIPGAPEVRTFEYDDDLNPIRVTSGGAEPDGRLVTRHRYDPGGNRSLTILPAGNRIRFRYDERSLPIARTVGFGTADAATTHVEYDGDGHPRRTVDARGNTTSFEYDALGRVVAEIDPLGHQTRRSYDKLGNVVVERRFERRGTGYVLAARVESSYDSRGRMIRTARNLFVDRPAATDVVSHFTDAGPGELLETQLYYDARDRLVRSLDPDGVAHSVEFDALGMAAVEQDALGNRVERQHDLHGSVTREDHRETLVDPATGAVTAEQWFASSSTYDELDRRSSETDSLGNTRHFEYDTRGNVTCTTDALGNAIHNEYDIHGRLITEASERTTTGLGGGAAEPPAVTGFEYDPNGNLVAVTDALGHRTVQRFDARDLRRAIVYPDGSGVAFELDPDGNVVAVHDANGTLRRIEVDALGRAHRIDFDLSGVGPDVHVEPCAAEEYDYDALGQRTSEANANSRCAITVDSLGRPVEERTELSIPGMSALGELVVRRELGARGATVSISYPSGRRITHRRDALDRLVTVTNSANGAAYPGAPGMPAGHEIAGFAPIGRRRLGAVFGNGAAVRYTHDRGGRTVESDHLGADGGLLTLQSLWDAARRLRQSNELCPNAPASGRRFGYDSLGRLARVEARNDLAPLDAGELSPPAAPPEDPIPNRQAEIDALLGELAIEPGAETWLYDLAGNRLLERTGDGKEVDYSVNALDQYTSVDGTALLYDRNGSLTHDGELDYRYDARGRLAAVDDTVTGATLVRLHYDARGRPVGERQGATAIQRVYDGANLIEEYRGSAVSAQVVHDDGIDHPIQLAAQGEEWWYHTDVNGSVRLLSDRDGAEAARYSYEPFGLSSGEAPPMPPNPFRFAGGRIDPATGTYDLRARRYSPRLGRFLQRDPLGMTDGTNLYSYVGNDPFGFADPDGKSRKEVATSPPALDVGQLTYGDYFEYRYRTFINPANAEQYPAWERESFERLAAVAAPDTERNVRTYIEERLEKMERGQRLLVADTVRTKPELAAEFEQWYFESGSSLYQLGGTVGWGVGMLVSRNPAKRMAWGNLGATLGGIVSPVAMAAAHRFARRRAARRSLAPPSSHISRPPISAAAGDPTAKLLELRTWAVEIVRKLNAVDKLSGRTMTPQMFGSVADAVFKSLVLEAQARGALPARLRVTPASMNNPGTAGIDVWDPVLGWGWDLMTARGRQVEVHDRRYLARPAPDGTILTEVFPLVYTIEP